VKDRQKIAVLGELLGLELVSLEIPGSRLK